MIPQRFVVIGGKGGVGRTTVAAALALSFARAGQRTLLATTGAHEHALSRLLGGPVAAQNAPVQDNLDAVSLRPLECIREYALMVLRLRSLQYLLVGTRPMQAFILSIPGIAEWAVMGKATYHLLEESGGRPRYDKVVLDAPASGHGLPLLAIPQYLRRVVRSGPFHRIAKERLDLLTDPAVTAVLLVAIPEEMAVSEAVAQGRAIARDTAIPVLAAVMNRAAETPFSRGEEERIEALRRAPGAPAELAAAWHLVMRRRIQERQLARLARAMPVVTLPRLPVRRLGPRDIEELSRLLGGRLDALSRG